MGRLPFMSVELTGVSARLTSDLCGWLTTSQPDQGNRFRGWCGFYFDGMDLTVYSMLPR